jgi:hypothetical protein
MSLIDLHQVDWERPDDATCAIQFRNYWNWMEVVAQYDDNPAQWNRCWALNYIRGLVGHVRPEQLAATADSFVRDGYLTATDLEGVLRGR